MNRVTTNETEIQVDDERVECDSENVQANGETPLYPSRLEKEQSDN